MSVSKYVYREECAQCEHHSHCDVSRHVRSSREERDYTEQVAQEDEEEDREQVWSIFPVAMLAYRRFYQVIIHHHDHHLHKACKALRSTFLRRIMLPVPLCRSQNQCYQQQSRDHQRCDILRYGNVKRTGNRSVCHLFHYLSFIPAFLRQEKALIFMSMLHF